MEGNVYEALKSTDVIGLLKECFTHYGYTLRDVDGKISAKLKQAVDTPWIHIRQSYRADGHAFDCYRWHKIQFDMISKNLKKPFVPSECQKCWKVVVKPQTVVQLFELENVQRQLDRPSKCGIEQRETVNELYGGYFYNESKEEGLRCYNIVKLALSQNAILRPLLDDVDEDGRTKRLMLKRACTEFEHKCGDSSKWEVTPEQLRIEALINRYVVSDDIERRQPDHLIRHIRKRWIDFACQWADKTYILLNGGKPIYPAYVTYHEEEKRNGKERQAGSADDLQKSNQGRTPDPNRGDGKKGSKGSKKRATGGTKAKPVTGAKKRNKKGQFTKTGSRKSK